MYSWHACTIFLKSPNPFFQTELIIIYTEVQYWILLSRRATRNAGPLLEIRDRREGMWRNAVVGFYFAGWHDNQPAPMKSKDEHCIG